MRSIRSRARTVVAFITLAGTLALPSAARAAQTNEFTYLTMSDGIPIAVAISYPDGFATTDDRAWPVLFMMDGYAGGAQALSTSSYGNNYVLIHASIRGTGCSGGRFDLFDRRSAQDGYEIIEWAAARPWANGKTGIVGHSYPGLTGFLVASTDPPSLTAIAISGLIDDLYRGIVYPGGVPNLGFPAVWTLGYRPAFELVGNASRTQSETQGADPRCAANVATRPARDVVNDPVVEGLNHEDSTWWGAKALRTYIRGITKPIHITQQYQDEQTGPRGGHVLWQNIPPSVPKRLVLTNGVHATTSVGSADRLRWLDCWMRGDCRGDILDPQRRVRAHFETRSGAVNEPYIASDWPLPESDWRRLNLRANGSLTEQAPGADEAATTYVSTGAGRQTALTLGMGQGNDGAGQLTYASGPDEAAYSLGFEADTAISGPMNLTLWASVAGVDNDFFVDILDQWPDGKVEYLQRGMQRASHRAIDLLLSDRIASGPRAGEIYRAYHPHTNPQPLVPGAPTKFEIEVFPLSHVFRAGHRLVLKVHAPPAVDPLSIYAYPQPNPPAAVQLLQDAAHTSSLLVPFLNSLPPLGARPACGQQTAIPCFKPVA